MKPMLFNTEMVRAILDGRKTVTRRIAHIRTDVRCYGDDNFAHKFVRDDFAGGEYTGYVCSKCGLGVNPPYSRYHTGTSWIRPYCEQGDILYVRETWHKDVARYMYKADYSENEKFYMGGKEIQIKWRPSIHMPKEAARLFLRVTGVRVERLQDLTDEDVIAEGLEIGCYFDELWDSTIPKKDRDRYGWNANPWVWVIEFERISKNERNELESV